MSGAAIVKQMDVVQGMLHKSVIALAIVPTNRSLTVTGRKAYSVMLHLAQMQARPVRKAWTVVLLHR